MWQPGAEGGLIRASEVTLAVQDSGADTTGCSKFIAPPGSFPGSGGAQFPRGWNPHSPFSSKPASVSKNEVGPHLSADSFENP